MSLTTVAVADGVDSLGLSTVGLATILEVSGLKLVLSAIPWRALGTRPLDRLAGSRWA